MSWDWQSSLNSSSTYVYWAICPKQTACVIFAVKGFPGRRSYRRKSVYTEKVSYDDNLDEKCPQIIARYYRTRCRRNIDFWTFANIFRGGDAVTDATCLESYLSITSFKSSTFSVSSLTFGFREGSFVNKIFGRNEMHVLIAASGCWGGRGGDLTRFFQTLRPSVFLFLCFSDFVVHGCLK